MHNVTTREAYLRAVVQHLPLDSHCVELGVLEGDFSAKILDILNPKHLVLIDPFVTNPDVTYGKELNKLPVAYSTENQYRSVLDRFEYQIIEDRIKVYRQYSYQAVSRFKDSFFDFIYIDGSHLYEDVKRDLMEWLPKLKDGGIIGGDDYKKFDNFGVIEAVDEFCKENNFEMIILNEQGGDFALKRK